MTSIHNAIKDAIEEQVGNGDWNGISVDDGRFEGWLETLDIDPDTIEVVEVDLDSGTMTVTASGSGTAKHKDADGNELSSEPDVKVTARVSINVGRASIVGVDNDD